MVLVGVINIGGKNLELISIINKDKNYYKQIF